MWISHAQPDGAIHILDLLSAFRAQMLQASVHQDLCFKHLCFKMLQDIMLALVGLSHAGDPAGAGVQPSTVRHLAANPSAEYGLRDTRRPALPRSPIPAATANVPSTASNGDAPLPPSFCRSCRTKRPRRWLHVSSSIPPEVDRVTLSNYVTACDTV
jgi:hypothetical protein